MIATSPTPGYQNYAPQAHQPAAPAQAQLEKMKLAAVAVINSYADAIAKGMQKMFADEFAACSNNAQVNRNELSEITLTKGDGTSIKLAVRSRKLQADFADLSIDEKINRLERTDRFIFNAIQQKTEELLAPLSKEVLRSIQAIAEKTLANHALVAAMPVTQSLIFKSQIYTCVTKLPAQHKAVILNLTK